MKQLCIRGAQIRKRVAEADQIFKSTLLRYFSESERNESQRLHLETLAAEKGEAEDAFRRHQKLCSMCAEALELSAFPC